MKLTSDFAILSVKGDRAKLSKHFENRPRLGPCPDELRVPITITGFIDSDRGNDDGVDQEFTVTVTSLTATPPLTPDDVKDLENYIEAEHQMTGLQVKARTALKKLKAMVA